MAKTTNKKTPIRSYAYRTGREHATLDHWYGPAQHVGEGVATDPVRQPEPPGVLRSTQKKMSRSHTA